MNNISESNNIDNIIGDIKKNNIDSKYLLFTDVDNQQICIQLSEDVYIYSQQNNINYSWDTDLRAERLKYMDKNTRDLIIAQCIFENQFLD
jgi:hypothetical protein